MTNQYKPGDKLEIRVQGVWQHGDRKYVGLTEAGKIVYEMDRSVFALPPESVRKQQVEKKGWALRSKSTNRLDSYVYQSKELAEKHAVGQWSVVEITWKE